jgi:hypothetical protein
MLSTPIGSYELVPKETLSLWWWNAVWKRECELMIIYDFLTLLICPLLIYTMITVVSFSKACMLSTMDFDVFVSVCLVLSWERAQPLPGVTYSNWGLAPKVICLHYRNESRGRRPLAVPTAKCQGRRHSRRLGEAEKRAVGTDKPSAQTNLCRRPPSA